MSQSPDRLYNLLPVVHRQRDLEQGFPLRDLLRVVAEQVEVVEADIAQLYENWFIETCQDWVVPYIGDLIGYRLVHEAGQPGDINTPQGRQLNKILIPRREVANTIRYRRRKGTLALLELLANDVANWPARVVEFYKLLGWTQHVNHLRLNQGRTVDLRQGATLDLLDSPFDELAHTVDVRHIQSSFDKGRYNLPDVGVFIWRLQSYSVTQTPAYCLEEVSPNCYTFSVLGNDTPLYNRPQPEADPTHIAGELNLPTPIRRRALENDHRKFMKAQRQNQPYESNYYGADKSLQIWVGVLSQRPPLILQEVPYSQILLADLSDWQYQPPPGMVAVDPVLGRMVFPSRKLPKGGVWVSYQYGFSADLGGGEYDRPLSQPAEHKLYQVGRKGTYPTINAAITQWRTDQESHAVIEITDSGVYTEQFDLNLKPHHSLQIRAANRTRPVIRLLDYQTEAADALRVTVQSGSRLVLDGLLIMGRGVQVQREMPDFLDNQPSEPVADWSPVQVIIRHSTLVPGWALHCDCEPKRPAEPSLELFNLSGQVEIEHSIVGSIQVNQDEVATEPLPIRISDSILDSTGSERIAIDAPGCPVAHTRLTILRSTVFGQVQVYALDLAENSIFMHEVLVASRQRGCVRFCYVLPHSRTPRRYHCQPDLVEQTIAAQLLEEATKESITLTQADIDHAKEMERERVRPRFNSIRYGTPTYCQLANTCAEEIKRGAEDESEMGVFHDLFQPQREANLRTRLDEYTPAGMETGIIYAN
jgi:hypothetical protein